MDLDTYQALGLHKPFSWEQPVNGRAAKEFGQFMQPSGDNQYHPCAEAFPAADLPRGNIEYIEAWADSGVFSGTQRDMWIYQPAQLDTSSEPPNLIFFQDGAGYVSPDGSVRAAAVLDTLIHAGELPPTVGVFVNPGTRRCFAVRRKAYRQVIDQRSVRAGDMRYFQRRDMRVDCGMVQTGYVRQGIEPLRFVHQHPWWPQLPIPGPYHGAQADSGDFDERRDGSEHTRWQLATCQQANGISVAVRRLRAPVFLR
jgi:hypothetical protein